MLQGLLKLIKYDRLVRMDAGILVCLSIQWPQLPERQERNDCRTTGADVHKCHHPSSLHMLMQKAVTVNTTYIYVRSTRQGTKQPTAYGPGCKIPC